MSSLVHHRCSCLGGWPGTDAQAGLYPCYRHHSGWARSNRRHIRLPRLINCHRSSSRHCRTLSYTGQPTFLLPSFPTCLDGRPLPARLRPSTASQDPSPMRERERERERERPYILSDPRRTPRTTSDPARSRPSRPRCRASSASPCLPPSRKSSSGNTAPNWPRRGRLGEAEDGTRTR